MKYQDYIKKRNELFAQAEAQLDEGKMDDYKKTVEEITALDAKYDEDSKARANLTALKGGAPAAPQALQIVNPNNTLSNEPKVLLQRTDLHDTIEYRQAFMEYCKTGKFPSGLLNVDEMTTVAEAGALVPTTLMKEIIKEMKVYGQIFQRVRKTNVQGGVEYPILTLKPVATWITEATPSDRKKVTANTKVSFSYYGLECKVAVSLLANTVTLDMFESEIIVLIAEAMVKAMEGAIVSGTGSGQPTGVTVDARVPAGNKITLSSADFQTWEGWKKNVFAKFKLAYRAGGSFLMAAGTFEGYIDGMVDANGQPIGRMNYGIIDGPQERFGGRPVMLVEDDIITPYDSASTGDVVAVFIKLDDYAINSNMQMMMFRWLDHDTNEWVDKAILICDGKILDANGVYLIKKGA